MGPQGPSGKRRMARDRARATSSRMVGDGTVKDKALPPDRPDARQLILPTSRCVISYRAVEAGPDWAVAKAEAHIIWRSDVKPEQLVP